VHRRAWHDGQAVRAELMTLDGAGHTVPQPWMRFPRMLGATIHSVDVAELSAQAFGWK
jgi:poly(3-hydroxybutyrate) depolymerase